MKNLWVDKNRVASLYTNGLTLREVAAQTGITMQRVHQIVCQLAPAKMRERGDRTRYWARKIEGEAARGRP